ncbi:MAG: helix-turn-helix transcriptional regulator [Candidatus Paceibacterota bacterium]|jgi:DNA-binding Xre family transcriptional regulator
MEINEMIISYKPLWHLMLDKNMKKIELRELARLSTTTLAKLGKDEPVNLDMLLRICNVFHCRIEDVVEFMEDE